MIFLLLSHCACFVVVCFVFEIESQYVAQADFELPAIGLAALASGGLGCRHVLVCLAFKSFHCHFILLSSKLPLLFEVRGK